MGPLGADLGAEEQANQYQVGTKLTKQRKTWPQQLDNN